ncbi:MAG: CHAT domain-containing protein [Acidobacteria bacterium]|nr:CHAT domain-containing protein [Acidobacteriota bacterium]
MLAGAGVRAVILNACRSGYTTGVASFGEELVRAGVHAVVAMQYSVYVESAAQFLSSMYEQLMRGRALSEAVTLARRSLAANEAVVSQDGRRLAGLAGARIAPEETRSPSG